MAINKDALQPPQGTNLWESAGFRYELYQFSDIPKEEIIDNIRIADTHPQQRIPVYSGSGMDHRQGIFSLDPDFLKTHQDSHVVEVIVSHVGERSPVASTSEVAAFFESDVPAETHVYDDTVVVIEREADRVWLSAVHYVRVEDGSIVVSDNKRQNVKLSRLALL